MKVVLGDGGYVLELERRGSIQADPYLPEVAVDHPEARYELHVLSQVRDRSAIAAGDSAL